MLSASQDNTLIVWDAATGNPDLKLFHLANNQWATTDGKGEKFIALGSEAWRRFHAIAYDDQGMPYTLPPERALIGAVDWEVSTSG
jgi:hypothetical protein